MPSEASVRPEIDRQPFQVGGWRADPSACRLARDGEEIHIEPKVMQVLVHLADRPGQVVSRRELEELVWTDTVVGYEAVTNAVIKLRKALGDDARHSQIIETIPKRGYRLLAEVRPVSREDSMDPRHPAVNRHETDTRTDAIPVSAGTHMSAGKTITLAMRHPLPAIVLAALAIVVAGVLVLWRPWHTDSGQASIQGIAFPLPDKPSIAVLPFDSFSGATKDDFIAKGMTEDIITALSKLPEFFVISRTSSFAFDDRTLSLPEVAKELGVRYIVDGSIQRSGATLRVNAQLVDALNGRQLWAENFDGGTEDLFSLQDDLVRRILVELDVELTSGDHARVASRGTTNLDAWLLRQQALSELYKFTRESTIRTRELLQRAHEADPGWSRPLGGLAFTYWWEAKQGWADDREEWIRTGIALAKQAIEMDPEDTIGYMQLGNLYQLQGDHDSAIRLREKAVVLAPNDFQANWGLGVVLAKAGQLERAVEVFRHAERVSPRHPASFTWAYSRVLLYAGRYEEAVETARRAIKRSSERAIPRTTLVAAYAALGRFGKAHNEAAEVLRIDPQFTVSEWKRRHSDFKDRAVIDRLADLLIEAGLPEQ